MRFALQKEEVSKPPPPQYDRYPTYLVLVLGPSGGKYSSVHYGVSFHTNEVSISDSCFLLRNMVNLGMFRTARYRGLQHALLGMFWAAQYQCSWATVTHSVTSWPEYHLPGPHNAWLFYFCQVCLAEKRHVWWEGWVCSLVSWEKNIALKGNCMSYLNLFYFLPFTDYFQGTRGLWWWS